MKKTNCLISVALMLLVLVSFVGCKTDNIKIKVLGDYVVELPTLTEYDEDAAMAKSQTLFGRFGCSGIGKVLDNGDMVCGRSFDLYYSNNPAFIIRTAIPGRYKTVGLAYNTFDGATFEQIKKHGVTQDELSTIIFFSEDIMNEKGLYIEANMREHQPEVTGIAECTGTNPGAAVKLPFPALVRYLGERCATVDEAVALVQTLNVHAMKTDEFSWGGGYFMADSTGHYGVMELIDNKIVWTDMANCQANFYVNSDYKERAIIGSGIGRYNLLTSRIDSVQSESDMQGLIEQVRYTNCFDPYSSPFDTRTELCGVGPAYESLGGMLTMEMAQNDEYKDMLLAIQKEKGDIAKSKSLAQLKNEGTDWLSVWQTIANCNKKSMRVIFFEDDNLTFDFVVE